MAIGGWRDTNLSREAFLDALDVEGLDGTGSSSALTRPCDLKGHRTGPQIEYIDGKVFAYCEDCHQRIEIERVPGGLSALRVQNLLVALRISEHDDITLYAEYNALRKLLVAEQEHLDAARAMLETAELMLAQRGMGL